MKKEFNIQMGLQIKWARESARLTQEQLSEMLGYTTQYISLMENGQYTISTKMLRTLCVALNISSDSILFPGSDRHCLDIISYKCKDISDEQFRLLIEIINRYIEAVTLK